MRTHVRGTPKLTVRARSIWAQSSQLRARAWHKILPFALLSITRRTRVYTVTSLADCLTPNRAAPELTGSEILPRFSYSPSLKNAASRGFAAHDASILCRNRIMTTPVAYVHRLDSKHYTVKMNERTYTHLHNITTQNKWHNALLSHR